MTTISADLLSQLRGFDTKQLARISNILQTEKDVQSFHAAIPSNAQTANALRAHIVSPGHEHIDDKPATESSFTHGFQEDLSSVLFVRRFWYGVIPATGDQQQPDNHHLLSIECKYFEIAISTSGDIGGTEANLIVQYRGEMKKAYVADYDRGFYLSGIEEKYHDDGGVLQLVNEVIKDIGLEGQVQPREMIDWLIRDEFPKYKEECLRLGGDRGWGSLRGVVSGLEEQNMNRL
ncbi:hypothetical protein VKT23_014061 [Stygiomarasmius scandens]|uniref:Uncharacterized protein n=1 Tax=Marasmiellus scandens TaxID=2682957 RepID=A0ABR1J1N1_9AGAR